MKTRPSRLLHALALSCALAACHGDKPLTEPAGALQAYAQALMSDDPLATWDTLDPSVQDLYHEALEILRDTEQHVDGVQPAERPVFRQRGGLDVFGPDATGRDLYGYLFRTTAIPRSEAFEVGARPLDTSIDGVRATMTTRSGLEVTALCGPDGNWRIEEPLLSIATEQLARIAQNRTNLRDTVALFGNARDIRAELVRLGVALPREVEATEGSGR